MRTSSFLALLGLLMTSLLVPATAKDIGTKKIGVVSTGSGELTVVNFRQEEVWGVALLLKDKVKSNKVQVLLKDETFNDFRQKIASARKGMDDQKVGKMQLVGKFEGVGLVSVALTRRQGGQGRLLLEISEKGKSGLFMMDAAQARELANLLDEAFKKLPEASRKK